MRRRLVTAAVAAAHLVAAAPAASAHRGPAPGTKRPRAARSGPSRPTTSPPAPAAAATSPAPAPGRSPADVAVATARAQLGKPYRWGAAGPDAFDCSGLTLYAWAAAGVRLPHSSRAQYASLPKVPLSQLRPGDLVYSPGHIGLYVGDGLMIHAPQSGRRVEVAPLRPRLIGAVRPG